MTMVLNPTRRPKARARAHEGCAEVRRRPGDAPSPPSAEYRRSRPDAAASHRLTHDRTEGIAPCPR